MSVTSLFSSALNFAGSLASQEGARTAQQTEMKYNAEQAAINRDFQTSERLASQEYMLDLFNLANEWNSIDSQLERARAAGVSPSAIIGGKVTDATAHPMSSQPMSGSTASTSSGGAIGSAALGVMPNMLNATGNFVKNMTDSFVARDMQSLNKQYMQSQINTNYASIKETLAKCGVAEATEAQIYQSMSWADRLNEAEVNQRLAQTTLYYNQCADILSLIEYRKAQETNLEYQNAHLASQDVLTMYQAKRESIEAVIAEHVGMKVALEELTVAQCEAIESRIRVNLANQLGAPVDASEFAMTYSVWKKGELPQYANEVLLPVAQASWKPEDWKSQSSYKFGGIEFLSKPEYFFGGFNPYTGDLNRSNTVGGSIIDSRRSNYKRTRGR